MKKVGHYRRVVWLQGEHQILQGVIQECFRGVARNELYEFDYTDDEQCIVARRRISRGGIYLHLVIFEAGAGAAVIPVLRRGNLVEAGEMPPPQGREFIQSQLFCRIVGNHIIWTTHNAVLRDASIFDVFAKLIGSLNDDEEASSFQFQAVLDAAAYERAFRRGIQEIDLGVGDFRPALERLVNDRHLPAASLFGALVSTVSRRLTRAQIEAASMVDAKIVLRPGRDWSNPDVVDLLARMADNVRRSHEDEFVIVTKDGLRLTRDKMSVHREYTVPGNRRLLDSNQVELRLQEIFAQLQDALVIGDDP